MIVDALSRLPEVSVNSIIVSFMPPAMLAVFEPAGSLMPITQGSFDKLKRVRDPQPPCGKMRFYGRMGNWL